MSAVWSLIKRQKEKILYLLFGGLTTAVSLGTFWLFYRVLAQNEHIANTASWVLAVLFAFITNRIWVFETKTEGRGAFVRQLLSFYGGRLLTFGLEEVLLFVCITLLSLDAMWVKVAAQVVVLILNYVISKLFVFRKTA